MYRWICTCKIVIPHSPTSKCLRGLVVVCFLCFMKTALQQQPVFSRVHIFQSNVKKVVSQTNEDLCQTQRPHLSPGSLVASFLSLLVQMGFIILPLVQMLLVKRNRPRLLLFYIASFQSDQVVLVLTQEMQLTTSYSSIFKSFIKSYPSISLLSFVCLFLIALPTQLFITLENLH